MAKKKEADEFQTCNCCGKELRKIQGFYLSYSPMYANNDNRMHMCKDCVLLFYDRFVDQYGDERKALYRLTLLLDVYFDEKMLESTYAQAKKQQSSIAKLYFQKINSMPQFRGKTSFDSVYVDLVSDFRHKEEVSIDTNKDNDNIQMEEFDEIQLVTVEMINRWGKGIPKDEYIYLEDRYQELIHAYECKTPIQRWLYEQIAKTHLEAEKSRRSGSLQMYEKMMTTLSKLMQDGNVKPVQEANNGDEESFRVGMIAKAIEEYEPVPKAVGDFVDPDKIRYYIEKWFVKPFAKVMDLASDEEAVEEIEGDTNDNS